MVNDILGDAVEPQVQDSLSGSVDPLTPIQPDELVGPFDYFSLVGTASALKFSQTAQSPSFGSAFLAGIEKDSFVFNNAVAGLEGVRRFFMEDVDPNFSPFNPKYLTQVSPEDYGDVSNSINENDFYRRVAKLNQEKSAREIAQKGSTVASLASGLADGITNPFYLIPIARGFKYVSGSEAFLSGFGRAVPGLVAGSALSEADLYATQYERSLQEVGVNIAANTLLGGILAGTGNAFRTTTAKIYKDMLTSVAEGKDVKFKVSDKGEIEGFTVVDDSVGAMSTREINLKGEALYGWGDNGEITAAKPLLWLTGKLARNPVILGLTSKSPTVRRFTNDAYDHNFHLAKNILDGQYAPVSVQNKIESATKDMMRMQFEIERSYYDYLGIDGTKDSSLILQDIKSKFSKDPNKLTNDQYKSAIYYTMVTGEAHNEAHINAQAKYFNDTYNKPLDEALATLGYIEPGESPYGAINHLSRMYDTRGIVANKPARRDYLVSEFNKVNNDLIQFTQSVRELEERINVTKDAKEKLSLQERLDVEREKIKTDIKAGKYDKKYLTKKDGEYQFRKILSDRSEIEEAADRTLDNILGLSEEQLYNQIVESMGANGPESNFLKERSLMLPDADLIKNGFLLTDINRALAAKMIRVRRLVELDNYFKSRGWDGKSKQLEFLTNGIREDYRALERDVAQRFRDKIANAQGDAKKKVEIQQQKALEKLNKRYEDDVRNVSSTYKRLSGNYDRKSGALIKTFRIIKQWAYATQLGAALLPSLQDAFSPIFRTGLSSYIKHGVAPFVINFAKRSKGNVRFRNDARDLALAIEHLTAYYGQRMPQTLDYTMPLDLVERGLDVAARGMSLFNLSAPFTDAFQVVAATATQSRLIRDLRGWKAGKLTRKAREQFGVLRLNPDELIEISPDKFMKLGDAVLQQYEKHGESLSGGYLMNWKDWDNHKVKELFQDFVKKEVKSVIFFGNNIASFPQGIEPNNIGSAFLTYMGYAFNASANFLLPFAQRPDFTKFQGLAAMTAMGMLIDPLRKIADGKEPELEPGELIKKGILNAGWGGILIDGFNRVNATFDVVPSLQVDKFRTKNAGELVLGAPGSLAVDAFKVAATAVNNEWNENDLKTAKRLIPFANLIYLRRPFNSALEGLNLPKTRAQARKEAELE